MKLRNLIVALAITAITAVGGFSLTNSSVAFQSDIVAGSGNPFLDDDVG